MTPKQPLPRAGAGGLDESMSLINDMLKDLEARKARDPLHQGLEHGGAHHIQAHGQAEGMHHADVTPAIEPMLQRHISWLFWPFMLVLVGLGLGLYWLAAEKTTPLFPSVRPSLEMQPPVATGAQPHQETTPAPGPVEPLASSRPLPPAPEQPRLLLLSAFEQGDKLDLMFQFDRPLIESVTVRRVGERIELRFPKVQVPSLMEAPHPALKDWRSESGDEAWVMTFAWPAAELPKLALGDTSQGTQRWSMSLPLVRGETPQPTPLSVQKKPLPSVPAKATPVESAPIPSRPQAYSSSLTPQQKAEALYAEAWQLQLKGKPELAVEKLRQALALLPEFSRGRELLAQILLKAGQTRAAEIELLRGLEYQPRQPELMEMLVRLWADHGRNVEALALLRERMDIDSISHQALFAILASRAGDHASAAEVYRRLAEREAHNPRWKLGLALALENLGQSAAARSAYQAALRLPGLDSASQAFIHDRLNHLGQGE